MDLSPKLFTVAEADAMLTLVAPLIQQLQRLEVSLLGTQEVLEEACRKLEVGNGHPKDQLQAQAEALTAEAERLAGSIQSVLKDLEALGCLVKDLGLGLVDFYTIRDGQLVFLCWKLGEDRIRFWHDVEDGFAGRQPLE